MTIYAGHNSLTKGRTMMFEAVLLLVFFSDELHEVFIEFGYMG